MEIKFRGKRIDNGEWVYGNFIIHDDILRPLDIKYYYIENYRGDDRWEVDPKTAGQFTGLRDKTGKEIYEGDILSFDGFITADNSFGFEPNGYIYDKDSVHCVIWANKMAAWTLNFDEDEEWKYMRDTHGLMCDECCEVIGNIHDNPELLRWKNEKVLF